MDDIKRLARETDNKLLRLMARCKAGVHLTINEHRSYYESAEHRLDDFYALLECPPNVSAEERAQMIAKNTIIDLQFYPNTPIGSYHLLHHDLDAALTEALAILEEPT